MAANYPIAIGVTLAVFVSSAVCAASKPTEPDREAIIRVVIEAFTAVHQGYSSDEVLLSDELNAAFLQACRQNLPNLEAIQANQTLLSLRKQGKLTVPTTRHRQDRDDRYLHAAEIAARWMSDKHKLNMDRVLCDPRRRGEFDRVASKVAPGVSPYLLRKAALRLRKSRRLRPELVLRVADWDKQVVSWSASELRADLDRIPRRPGVYLFRDQTGYLYVGESADLHRRVAGHLDRSDRDSLAHYLASQKVGPDVTVELHIFDPASPARRSEIRRAYESELIASRKPRFNVRP